MTIKVPMLSPVLEDFVPPQFRGNIPDDWAGAESPAVASTAGAPLQCWWTENRKNPSENNCSSDDGGMCSWVVLRILRWRRNAQRGGLGQVPQKKPVQIEAFRRRMSSSSSSTKKYLRSSMTNRVIRCINPLCLFAKLRDTYIHMMQNVASSRAVVGGANQGLMFNPSANSGPFPREFDGADQSMAQLVMLDRSSSKPDSEYRQNMAANISRSVKPCCEILPIQLPVKPGDGAADPVLSRSNSRVYPAGDANFFSTRRSGSRRKLHINPYADGDWKAEACNVETKVDANGDRNAFQFQRTQTDSSGADQISLQQAAADGSQFCFRP